MKYLSAILIGIGIGWGMGAFPVGVDDGIFVALGIMLFACIVIGYVIMIYGSKILLGVSSVGIIGVVIEYIAIKTCFPYGCFTYSELVGPRLLETFPYALLAIWPILVIFAWSWTAATHKGLAVLQGGTLLVFLDIFLDPVAVDQGVWSYDFGGVWFGVPISNYLGWIPVSIVSVLVFSLFAKNLQGDVFLRCGGVVIAVQYLTYFLLYCL